MEQPTAPYARFWGVRGSIPTPGAETSRYGGNTACVEVRCGDDVFVLDAGSGARGLGAALLSESTSGRRIRLLLTHFHRDHLEGLPFFQPLYDPDVVLEFYAGVPAEELEDVLSRYMAPPFFPIDFAAVPAQTRVCTLGSGLEDGDWSVRPVPLNHPQGATGYRIRTPEGTLVYATDHEWGDQSTDAGLERACRGADVLIFDSQFTPEEYPSRRGWGHSTWMHGVRLARDAGVGRLVLFHHDPGHDDGVLDAILEAARAEFPATEMAREGDRLTLRGAGTNRPAGTDVPGGPGRE